MEKKGAGSVLSSLSITRLGAGKRCGNSNGDESQRLWLRPANGFCASYSDAAGPMGLGGLRRTSGCTDGSCDNKKLPDGMVSQDDGAGKYGVGGGGARFIWRSLFLAGSV